MIIISTSESPIGNDGSKFRKLNLHTLLSYLADFIKTKLSPQDYILNFLLLYLKVPK